MTSLSARLSIFGVKDKVVEVSFECGVSGGIIKLDIRIDGRIN